MTIEFSQSFRSQFSQRWVDAGLAWFFVIVWGSGFLATKIALHYTTPFLFLSMRYALGLLFLGAIAIRRPVRWPVGKQAWIHVIIAGLLLHAVNLGGSHYAQYLGLSAGTTALILAAQPLLTAGIASLWLHERLAVRQWAGVALGLAGVVLVVWHKIDIHAMSEASLLAVTISLVGTTVGTLYQRRFCGQVDLRAGSMIQFLASFLLVCPLALIFEGVHVIWAWPLLYSAAFLVIGASILALNAFHLLMRRGQATRVATLLYLTPVIATILEFFLFHVVPSFTTLFGMAIVCLGVILVTFHSRRFAPLPRGLARSTTD